MHRKHLAIIGNGMAGIRTLEEILARGGAEKFAITVFGDEPYGNYNRIMLSHVLAGEEDEADIFLNALSWYAENDITLHTGTRVDKINRYARVVYAQDGTSTPPAGHSDHQMPNSGTGVAPPQLNQTN